MIIFLILVTSLSSHAKMLLANPDNKDQFNIYTKTNSIETYIESHLLKQRTQSSILNIKNLFEKAQISYYSNDYKKAKELFSKMTAYTQENYLEKDYQDAISMSYLKLASMQTQIDRVFYFLQQALVYNPKFKPTKNTIKPDIAQKWLHIQSEEKLVNIDLKPFKSFDIMYINHNPIDLANQDNIQWPEGLLQVRLLSNHYKSLNKEVITSQLNNWRPTPVAMASGRCEKPKTLEYNYDLFYSDKCIVKKKQLQLRTKSIPALAKVIITEKRKKSILKSVWFWLSLATVGYVINERTSPNSEPEIEPIIINY